MKKATKRILWGVLTLVIIGLIVLAIWALRAPSEEIRTASVETRRVAQEVTVTGRVAPKQEAKLAFELTGAVASILVKEGDTVTLGQALLRLDAQSVNLELAKASADTLSAQDEAYKSWQKAETDWQNTKAENDATLNRYRQAVRDAKTSLDQSKEVWLQYQRDNGDDDVLTKAAYGTYLTAQTTYRAAQQTLILTEKSAAKTTSTARATADIAKAQYTATTQAAAGTAGLSSLEATREIAALKAAKSVLKAPFAGVVTTVDAEIGQLAIAGTAVVTVATIDQLEVTASVPETDALKLQENQIAKMTIDAVPGRPTLEGQVASIAPAAAVLEGVPTYEVTISLPTAETALKPGLTADITIETAARESVVAIPRRAVITRDGQQVVRVQEADETVREQNVTTGLLGSDGFIEITSGLTAGGTVLLNAPR